MKILKFFDYVTESKKVVHAGDSVDNSKSDKKLEKEVSDSLDKSSDRCPRCGEPIEDCICGSSDYWSTQTYHRTPTGKKEKSKPKQNFKKEE